MPVTVQLSWPANPASEFVQSYQVFASKDGGAFTLVGSPTVPLMEILNPLPGHYRYKVRAVNFVGVGPDSNIAEGPDIPTAPGDMTVVVITS